ncbi:ABC transporter permease [Alteribacillus bidgolensis]|uniref:Monosaccharide ABC transporter membrane protein, CUT2 family n=1 Tax=Alteribacillus bidgolensis TaxID=930129 RepID=A0A1G8E6F0_9BACI|nr:ABC transporter permease [Alteribacillus bidgolensis]SDH65538.1 monosaccharide ABC transporter membrane protein, CUT2 family [Alteribacillus bidgolensis]
MREEKAQITTDVRNLELSHSWKQWMIDHKQVLSIFGILFLICAFFSIVTGSFLSYSNMMNLVMQLAPNLIVAVAMTFVITTGGIDLSVGSILALASALTAVLLSAGTASPLVLLIVIIAGIAMGCINGYVVAYHNIPPLIVTLAAMLYVRGLALLITGGYSIAISSDAGLTKIGIGSFLGVPVPAILAVIIMVFGVIALRNSRYGTYVTGIGANEEAVRRAGVNTKYVKLITYMFSGGAAALAGLILASRLGSGSSNIGMMFELDIIAAVVLGGTALFGGAGTILGSLIGVTMIGVINNGLTLMQVSPYIIQIMEGLVLLMAVIINVRVFGKKRM